MMSFIDLWSPAWSWVTPFAILCLKVAKVASDAKAPSSPPLPVVVPSLPSAVVLAGPRENVRRPRSSSSLSMLQLANRRCCCCC